LLPLDAVPKKYQNAGLRKDFKSKKLEVVDPLASGGLNDEDAFSERPKFPPMRARQPLPQTQKYPENLQRDPSQRNEVSFDTFSCYLTTNSITVSLFKSVKAVVNQFQSPNLM
jgi:hypothetical protein